jgi:hypothetical protein
VAYCCSNHSMQLVSNSSKPNRQAGSQRGSMCIVRAEGRCGQTAASPWLCGRYSPAKLSLFNVDSPGERRTLLSRSSSQLVPSARCRCRHDRRNPRSRPQPRTATWRARISRELPFIGKSAPRNCLHRARPPRNRPQCCDCRCPRAAAHIRNQSLRVAEAQDGIHSHRRMPALGNPQDAHSPCCLWKDTFPQRRQLVCVFLCFLLPKLGVPVPCTSQHQLIADEQQHLTTRSSASENGNSEVAVACAVLAGGRHRPDSCRLVTRTILTGADGQDPENSARVYANKREGTARIEGKVWEDGAMA